VTICTERWHWPDTFVSLPRRIPFRGSPFPSATATPAPRARATGTLKSTTWALKDISARIKGRSRTAEKLYEGTVEPSRTQRTRKNRYAVRLARNPGKACLRAQGPRDSRQWRRGLRAVLFLHAAPASPPSPTGLPLRKPLNLMFPCLLLFQTREFLSLLKNPGLPTAAELPIPKRTQKYRIL
jgi:hypothetical protein